MGGGANSGKDNTCQILLRGTKDRKLCSPDHLSPEWTRDIEEEKCSQA